MHKFCNLRIDGSISTAVLQVEDAQDAADAVQGDDYSEAEYMELLTEAIKKRGLSHVITINSERFGAVCKGIGIHQTKSAADDRVGTHCASMFCRWRKISNQGQ